MVSKFVISHLKKTSFGAIRNMKNPNATAYAPIPNSNTVYSINYDS